MTRRKAIKLALAALAGAAVSAGVAATEGAVSVCVPCGAAVDILQPLAGAVRVRIMHPDVHGGRWFDVPGSIGDTGHVDLKLPKTNGRIRCGWNTA